MDDCGGYPRFRDPPCQGTRTNSIHWTFRHFLGIMVVYILYPIGSMYVIYGNIYHQYTPVMLAYIPYMDPMGTIYIITRNSTWGSDAGKCWEPTRSCSPKSPKSTQRLGWKKYGVSAFLDPDSLAIIPFFFPGDMMVLTQRSNCNADSQLQEGIR